VSRFAGFGPERGINPALAKATFGVPASAGRPLRICGASSLS